LFLFCFTVFGAIDPKLRYFAKKDQKKSILSVVGDEHGPKKFKVADMGEIMIIDRHHPGAIDPFLSDLPV
ncbi:MAG: hypothetical protein IKH72_02285, partial [Firmicutes bacterium]|nr:hypothetical protein [Bacillota bacterium]